MKFRLLLIISLCLLLSSLFGWDLVRQSQFPTNFYNMDVVGSHVWTVGTGGVIAHSTDNGSTYSFVANPGFNVSTLTFNDYLDVDFYDQNNGIVVGVAGYALKTTDGGATWTVLTGISSIFTTNNIQSVVYHSDGKVWACGNSGLIGYSADNGATWTAQTSGTTNTLYSISMNDAGVGFIAGAAGTPASSKLLRTADFGTTWAQANITIATNPNLNQVKQFGNNVLVVGDTGFLANSTDNGLTFTNHPLVGGATVKMQDVCMNGNNGFAVGWGNAVLSTTDNWTTITSNASNFGDYYEGVAYNANGDVLGACWKGFLLKSTNGFNWTELTIPTNTIFSTSIVDNTTWYSAADVGYILKTTDAGAHFTRIQIPGEFNRFYCVYFKNANEGWVSGKTSGKIYHTTDGGQTWTNFQVAGVSVTKSYYEIQFLTDQIGYIIGVGDKNAKTTDGGLTWTALANVGLTSANNLLCGYFKSETVGFAGSSTGKLYVTQDGGTNWTLQTIGTYDITDIWFKDDLHGVLTTKSGTIYYTSNGGLNATDWTLATESATGDINGVFCNTSGEFYATAFSSDASWYGNSWALLKSTDNGASWTQETIPTLTNNDTRLYGVSGKGDRLVVFGGNQVVYTKGATVVNPTYATDLFISEYIEGTSNNKAIEIFNGTGAPVSLSQYSVKLAANGGAWTTTLTSNRVIANNDVYIIANAGANATILAQADTTSTVTYFNGNDAVGLFKNDQLLDTFGLQGNDPGSTSGWTVAGVTNATKDHTIVRKPTIGSPTSNWATSAGTSVDDSQWLVLPVDTFTNLGTHTFTPTTNPQTGSPTFSPNAGLQTGPINVSLSCATPNASIYYTTDGTDPSQTSTLYTTPIPLSANTTVKARAYATGMDPSYITQATYTFPVVVNSLAALRLLPADNATIYRLTNEVVLSYAQTFRHQKFMQDATAGMLIDDNAGALTTAYVIGDGITGLMGKMTEYGGMFEFIPTMDAGVPSSTGNVLTPITITMSEYNTNYENYESRLVKVTNVTFTDATVNFANGTVYPIASGDQTGSFRTTFYDVDYIGTPVPGTAMNLIGIPNSRTDGNYISSRYLADFEFIGVTFNPPTNLQAVAGNAVVNLSWSAPASLRNGRNLTGYNVYRDNVNITATPITTITYADNTVTNGTQYSYHVTAVYTSPNGESVASNTVTATPIATQFNPPSNLQAGAGNAHISLTWNAPAAFAASSRASNSRALNGFKIFRNDVLVTTVPSTTLNYNDAGLTNGTEYTYYVTAVYTSPDGESVHSNSVSATPVAPVLNAPTNLSAAQSGHNVVLNWTAPIPAQGTTLMWINIYRNDQFVTNIDMNLTTWTDTNVAAGQYSYKVSAGYMEGESGFSNVAGVTVANVDPTIPIVRTELLGSAPNPFHEQTTLYIQLKNPANTVIQIYNLKGQKVRTLVSGVMKEGVHHVTWDGTDDQHHSVPNGVYFCKMKAGSYIGTEKVILLK